MSTKPFRLTDFSQKLEIVPIGDCEHCGAPALVETRTGVKKGVWTEPAKLCNDCFFKQLKIKGEERARANDNPNIKVKLLDRAAFDADTPQHKMKVVFEGTMPECHKYCDEKGFKFQRDCSLFGGYYADFNGPEEDFGDCYLLDL